MIIGAVAMIRRLRWRPRFGLRTAFLLLTIATWCAWQWSLSQRRRMAVADLTNSHCYTCRSSSAPSEKYHEICKQIGRNGGGGALPQSALGVILGYDNFSRLTVFIEAVYFIEDLGLPDKLRRLPGLTTIVIFDGNPESERKDYMQRFKQELKKKLPGVKVEHRHYSDIWVVG
jgi:hypothetical protein